MLIAKIQCDECDKFHFVEVLHRERRSVGNRSFLAVTKTKCHAGKMIPTDWIDGTHYIKHIGFGEYRVCLKSQPKKRGEKMNLPQLAKFKTFETSPAPVAPPRKCIAEMSLSVREKYVTIKVFEDATPEKFYEIFYEVGGTPAMIKTRNVGGDAPVHITDLPKIFKSEGLVKLTYHNRNLYEELLTADFNSTEYIMKRNARVVSTVKFAKQS
jgi:hypothetical protein